MDDIMVMIGDLMMDDLVTDDVVMDDLIANDMVDDFTDGVVDVDMVGLANGFYHGLVGCLANGVDLDVDGVVGTGVAGVIGRYCSCLDNNWFIRTSILMVSIGNKAIFLAFDNSSITLFK